MIEASIIIPVYNNWRLTESCLRSLAATVEPGPCEVLVIDNASSDETPKACAQTGESLFGKSFKYIRNEVNRNFAGASNQGAAAAQGQFLVFLNNDTEPQKDWLAPLLADFSDHPNIAATGPILAYPETTPLGLTVQHLGIVFNPWLRFSHLYKGIPVGSALAKKRRFFQAITAACMVIPRSLFLEVGGFDEGFVNGFEDVDLCARLWVRGHRFTVNPASLVLHHESRTEGRTALESLNSGKLEKGNLIHFGPDWQLKIGQDGLDPHITPFGVPAASYPAQRLERLNGGLRGMRQPNLIAALEQFPLWEGAWHALFSQIRDPQDRLSLYYALRQVFPTPENMLAGCNLALRLNDAVLMGKCFSSLKNSIDSPQSIRHKVEDNREWCANLGLEPLARAYDAWLVNYANFRDKYFPEFAASCLKLFERISLPISPTDAALYNVWLAGNAGTAGDNTGINTNQVGFSILMPVYDPRPEHLKKAIESVLAQTHGNWELCLADDASPNPGTREIIREYSEKDARIKYVFREENGHTAQAANSALEVATRPWIVFMDDDDELAPNALESMARAVLGNPQGKLFFSDEDKITEYGHHNSPYLKNGIRDRELLLHQNFVRHLTVCETARLKKLGGFRDGYPGAQDHELILRYSEGLQDDAFVHVPEILYHWREHEKSTARNQAAEDCALDSAVRAVQTHLDRVVPGALATRMEDTGWTRVRYPLPADRPLVSIVSEKAPFACYGEFLKARTSYPFELVDAPEAAAGEILAFIGHSLLPWSHNWLEELVGCLMRPGIGAVGGSLTGSDGRQIHAGYLADSSGKLKPVFRNAAREPYNGWLALPRTVSAVDGLCLLTRKQDFAQAGGLDAAMGSWAFQDYCLRLGQNGLRSVWWPFARLIADSPVELADAPQSFNEKWRLTPFNSNLRIVDEGFALTTGAQQAE